jgi:hypothetical protein
MRMALQQGTQKIRTLRAERASLLISAHTVNSVGLERCIGEATVHINKGQTLDQKIVLEVSRCVCVSI